MLEFNQEHKLADLSAIKSKVEKIRTNGKVILCGVLCSAVVLLSGCSYFRDHDLPPSNHISDDSHQTITAIIIENGNALIVDLKSYEKYAEREYSFEGDVGGPEYSTRATDRTWVLYTVDGDRLYVNVDLVKFIEGEDSHKKAETIAQTLINDDGKITCYDEIENYGKTR